MAKLEQIQRLLYIAELLKNKPNGITYEETKNFLEKKCRIFTKPSLTKTPALCTKHYDNTIKSPSLNANEEKLQHI